MEERKIARLAAGRPDHVPLHLDEACCERGRAARKGPRPSARKGVIARPDRFAQPAGEASASAA